MKSAPHTLSPDLIAEVEDQTNNRTPAAIIEAIACQLHLAREARHRIVTVGSVVRDPKGSVFAHPAIQVEAAAIKIYTALLAKWMKRR